MAKKQDTKPVPKARKSEIRPCNCKDDYQDKRYGPGNRVMNGGKDGVKCTKCGSKHS